MKSFQSLWDGTAIIFHFLMAIVPCDPHKPNAFAVMLAAQNELQLPPKPVGEKLSEPRLHSDIITWISNFERCP
jgi:hypothetical protein